MKYLFLLCTCAITTIAHTSDSTEDCQPTATAPVTTTSGIPRSIKIDDFQQLKWAIKTEERKLRGSGAINDKNLRYVLATQIAIKKLIGVDWPACCWPQRTPTTGSN